MKILVATDGSRGGEAAVRQAGKLAGAMRSARVTVVMAGAARRQIVLGSAGVGFPMEGLPEMEAAERRWGEGILAKSVRSLKKARVAAASRFLSAGLAPVAEAILREANRIGADLLIVGNEGWGAIREMAFGSVTLRLLNLARCPLLVVRPPLRGSR
jgi:nucleotide-binding universal stress UspA family protein